MPIADPTLNFPVVAKKPAPTTCDDPPYNPKPPYTYAQRADMEGWSLQKRMEWQAGNMGEAAGAAVIGLFIGIVTYVLIVLARSD